MKTAWRFDNGCDCKIIIMMMTMMKLSVCVYGRSAAAQINYVQLIAIFYNSSGAARTTMK